MTPPEQHGPTPGPAAGHGFGLVTVLLALATGVIIGIGAVLILGELDPPRRSQGREIAPQAQSQWQHARAQWDTRGPRDYRFVYSTSAYVAATHTQVEVRDRGAAITLIPLDDAGRAGSGRAGSGRTAPTIDGLFSTIQNEQRISDSVTVEYHPELGYPTRVDIDGNARGADDEFHIAVDDLQPLPPT